MRVVIVYESLFGNTRQVAEAIAEGVHEAAPQALVSCVRATEANREVALAADLLAVGGPTHMCGMSSGFSRKNGLKAEQVAAAREAGHRLEPGDAGPGVRDWFMALPKAAAGSLGAAFDICTDSLVTERAAEGIARRLRRHGYELVAEPESFVVDHAHGPLHEGERERARAWGARLIRQPVPEPAAGQYPFPPPEALADGLAAGAAAPEAVISCHTPPDRLSPLPLAWPGDVSPA